MAKKVMHLCIERVLMECLIYLFRNHVKIHYIYHINVLHAGQTFLHSTSLVYLCYGIDLMSNIIDFMSI